MKKNYLRDLARGKDCQVRIAGVCNFNPETTVLAHIRRGGVAGFGQKPNDLIAVWSCSSCHDVIDGRSEHPDGKYGPTDGDVLAALCRTLKEVYPELGL